MLIYLQTRFLKGKSQKIVVFLAACISIVKLVLLHGAGPEELKKTCKNLKLVKVYF